MENQDKSPSIGEARDGLSKDLLSIIEAQVDALEAMVVEQARLKGETVACSSWAIVAASTAAFGYLFEIEFGMVLGVYLAFLTVWLGKITGPYFAERLLSDHTDLGEEKPDDD